MELISLIVLCATLVIAFIFKLNSGLVSIAVALILSLIAGIPGKFLISSFNNSLFLMLLGVMLLFSIAQENKTLDLLAKKIFSLCKGRVKLLPIVMFLTGAVISAIGPGLISTTALVSVLVVALAEELDIAPIRLVPFAMLGAFAGGLSPITPSGIVAVDVATKSGIIGVEASLPWAMAITCTIYAVILYFVFKWHKAENLPLCAQTNVPQNPPFSVKQIITLVGIVIVAVITSVFGINVGLVSFAASVVLILFKAADENAALKKVPWSTLVMVTGVGILLSLVTELGGIDLLSTALIKLSTPKTASTVMTLLSGIMSWVSSASGVVMPTLIPTVPDMVSSLPGTSALELVNSICIGANIAPLSPLSTCGALMLAAYSSARTDAKARNKMFAQLFTLSACGVALASVLALLGLY